MLQGTVVFSTDCWVEYVYLRKNAPFGVHKVHRVVHFVRQIAIFNVTVFFYIFYLTCFFSCFMYFLRIFGSGGRALKDPLPS